MRNWLLLKCVSGEDGRYVLREIHEGICESHIGAQVLVAKAMRYGYYWPSMKEDFINLVKACTKFQIHANEHYIPTTRYHIFGTPILFA